MKYANLKHNGLARGKEKRIVNIGDAFEIISIDQIYERMGILSEDIVYIDLYELDSYDGEEVVLPINFLLFPQMMGKDFLNFSKKITPVFLGVSFAQTELTRNQVDYLKQWEPIGCRDERTKNVLLKQGIDAYIGGCMVATIECEIDNEKEKSKVAFIDVPQFVEPYIPNYIKKDIEILDHELYLSYNEVKLDDSIINSAKERMRYYKNEIRMIVTSRFHGAVIGLALGIPVILVAENNFFKFSWLSKLLPFYDLKTVSEIDWNPCQTDIDKLRTQMITLAINRIQNAVMLKVIARDIDVKLSNSNRCDDNALIYINEAVNYIKKNWGKNDNIQYALWGINQNAQELFRFIQKNYLNVKLVAVYDGVRNTEFHGIVSQYPSQETIHPNIFIFVTSNTANKTAEELFKTIKKENYFLCQLNFIKEIGE